MQMFPVESHGLYPGATFKMDNAMKKNSTTGIYENLRVDFDHSTGHVKFTQDGVLLHEKTYV